ncbi:uncharacterized protein LOC123274772 isoform X1 [Cotesia glomerata]|uniref:uncharacterized protein LOC123274772 isoform X1 n=1 Tax=Cotesia glomerata TaxID=32391 RepID=UPI001D01BF63|nr:uncharacterized protein LOC123274772 isoform X1 [Cotesia glomerata]
MCSGSGCDSEKSSVACTVLFEPKELYKKQAAIYRCDSCRQVRKKIGNQLYRPKLDIDAKNKKLKLELNSVKKKNIRLTNKNETLKLTVEEERQRCAHASEILINQETLNLPPIQQETVKACFAAAKAKNSKQRRYTIEWVYECLLIRIKSSSVYDRLRSRQILPFPCKDTLQKYIQKLDSAFGFSEALFETFKLKGSRMEVNEKRGIFNFTYFLRVAADSRTNNRK